MIDMDFIEEESELEGTFNAATKYVEENVKNFTQEQLLELYAWYKQSTAGDCEGNRPGILQMAKRAKWDAWNRVKGTQREAALEKYVEIVRKNGNFSPSEVSGSKSKSWVSVSTQKPEDDDIQDEDKTIYDHVQQKNFEKFVEALENFEDVNILDETGLSVLHWAADRGQSEMLRLLLKRPEVNVNVLDEDGQTPLHYAAFCGHPKCAEMLLDAGADTSIKDDQDQTCHDVACDDNIRFLLTK
ncbi:acyl-CoA-binding domain-containing protein 6 [Phlebotomus argentipes]|uniref:acyl-CoA-binding domain-containing protein 6 n=1 Tax=Phlebotomus argentipes TaxID=94469 RepID=UPI00289376F8|nr:acyl-CoA-binding domain-containing protein 6 [Phlebotomus argentipes]